MGAENSKSDKSLEKSWLGVPKKYRPSALWQKFGSWCKQLPPFAKALLVTALVFVLIGVQTSFLAFDNFLSSRLLTTTVKAETESFSMMTPNNREVAWSLPPGRFSMLGGKSEIECNETLVEMNCEIDQNSRLVVEGQAGVEIRSSAEGGWTVSISRSISAPADISLFDVAGNVLLRTDQLLNFSADPTVFSVRFPFVATSAIVGADLYQPSSIEGTPHDFWQPILLSGNVQMIADNKPGREKYEILRDQLDPGDVIHIANDAGEQSGDDSPIWGMVTIGSVDRSQAVSASVFQIVLHTSLRDLTVTRFGAPEGHVIKASGWTIWQKWPNGQMAWVTIVSIILVFSFLLTFEQFFRRHTDDD